nr:50S ribosomal protein L6P [uncultured archaeon]
MHLPELKETIAIPQGVTAAAEGATIVIKGPKGELRRAVGSKAVVLSVEGNHVVLRAKSATKNEKRTLNTNAAHIRNMLRGAKDGHVYKLKICSGHFPMSVTLKGDHFEVKNFIGEAVPRTLKIKQGVKVTIAGADITVEGANKELVGNQAAAIELLTRRPGFDTRVFQDGIYITEKDSKKV